MSVKHGRTNNLRSTSKCPQKSPDTICAQTDSCLSAKNETEVPITTLSHWLGSYTCPVLSNNNNSIIHGLILKFPCYSCRKRGSKIGRYGQTKQKRSHFVLRTRLVNLGNQLYYALTICIWNLAQSIWLLVTRIYSGTSISPRKPYAAKHCYISTLLLIKLIKS